MAKLYKFSIQLRPPIRSDAKKFGAAKLHDHPSERGPVSESINELLTVWEKKSWSNFIKGACTLVCKHKVYGCYIMSYQKGKAHIFAPFGRQSCLFEDQKTLVQAYRDHLQLLFKYKYKGCLHTCVQAQGISIYIFGVHPHYIMLICGP